MKHCKKCNVEIADNLKNCPLCGSSIDTNESFEQSFLSFPTNKIWYDKRKLTLNIILTFVLIGLLISFAVDLFFNRKLAYSWYTITGCAMFLINIYFPIKKHWSFSTISTISGISIGLYILFIELYTQTFGWGFNYVIPFFILFMSCNSTIIIFMRNYYKGFEFTLPLIIFTILATITFAVSYVLDLIIWPSFSVFLASSTLLIIVLVFKSKKVKQELEKSFFV